MYLSRLVLNPRDGQARRDLTDCQGLHRTLLRAFPDGVASEGAGARARCGLLFRTEHDPRTGAVQVLAQSHIEPDWERLPPGYAHSTASRAVDGYVGGLGAGARLRFRLRANPTRRIGVPRPAEGRHKAEKKGQRVELAREEDQLAWLARKGEAAGFRLLTVRARPDVVRVQAAPEGKLVGRKGREDSTGRLTFGSVLFEGELEVTDTAVFREALAQGIGSGKAYGFGLLSVAPVAG